MRLKKPSESDLTEMAVTMSKHQTLKALCAVMGPVLTGAGLGQVFHGNLLGVMLIVAALPFIAVTVWSAVLSRHLRLKRARMRQTLSHMMAAHMIHRAVSALQPDASCVMTTTGDEIDEIQRLAEGSV